jgi:hypothetical protein
VCFVRGFVRYVALYDVTVVVLYYSACEYNMFDLALELVLRVST